MAKAKTHKEREVLALELLANSFKRIADSVETFEDVTLNVDPEAWSERLEWYLNEFYLLLKGKVIGTDSDRPKRKVSVKK